MSHFKTSKLKRLQKKTTLIILIFFNTEGNMMYLHDYLFRKSISITQFSEMLECDRSYLSLIVNGKKPGKRLAKEIERMTEGLVTVHELMNPIKEKKNGK